MPRTKSTPRPKPSGPASRRISEAAAARIRADEMRQAECAAMLIAVTRMLLDLRGRDFALWLRSIADDFEATDPDTEDPDDLGLELARKGGSASASARPAKTCPAKTGVEDDDDPAMLDEADDPSPDLPRRPH